jgi:prepilin-type N-terminal cleavage/methylation domain-containing protein
MSAHSHLVRQPAAFTLVELLVVIAIIGILALLAVVNLQEASTRAKVSGVRSGLRVVAQGLEAYALDQGRYPPTLVPQSIILGNHLTTPIAYVGASALRDSFSTFHSDVVAYRSYANYKYFAFPEAWPDCQPLIGSWYLCSIGPDRQVGPFLASNHVGLPYDPTNGTASDGELVRTAKSPEGRY